MPLSYTNLLRFTKMANLSSSSVWGTTLNRGVVQLAEDAITGQADVDVTVGNVVLSTENGRTDQARQLFIRAVGDPGITRQVIVPPIPKLYVFENRTFPAHDVIFRTPAGSGITLGVGRVLAAIVDPVSLDVIPLEIAGAFAKNLPLTTVEVAITDSAVTAQVTYAIQGSIALVYLTGVTAVIAGNNWVYQTNGVVPAALAPAVNTDIPISINNGGTVVQARFRVPSNGNNWEIQLLDGSALDNTNPRSVIDLTLMWALD